MSQRGPAPDLSVVLPVYNGADYIRSSLAIALDTMSGWDISAELIVVDDGSTDDTAAILAALEAVRAVRLGVNSGKGAALRAGMLAARGRVRAFTDADLPYGLGQAPLAMEYITARGFHAVTGDRTLPGSSYEPVGWTRAAVSEVASFAFRTLVTGGIYDTQCGFKVFRGDVADEIFRLSVVSGFAVDVELLYLLLKYRLDVKRVPVQLQRNAPSSVRVLRDSGRAMRDIARMRVNWARGRYRSRGLVEILSRDLQRDRQAAATAYRRSVP